MPSHQSGVVFANSEHEHVLCSHTGQQMCPTWRVPGTPRALSDPLAPFSSWYIFFQGKAAAAWGEEDRLRMDSCRLALGPAWSAKWSHSGAHPSFRAWPHHTASLMNKAGPWEVTLSLSFPGGGKNQSKLLLLLLLLLSRFNRV